MQRGVVAGTMLGCLSGVCHCSKTHHTDTYKQHEIAQGKVYITQQKRDTPAFARVDIPFTGFLTLGRQHAQLHPVCAMVQGVMTSVSKAQGFLSRIL
jgi:hypothetical protein